MGIRIVVVLSLAMVFASVARADVITNIQTTCNNSGPAAAATAAQSFFVSTLSGNPSDCSKLCKKWVSACKGAVAGEKACFTTATAKVVAVRMAQCKTAVEPQRSSCLDTLMAEKQAAKDFIAAEVDAGKASCTSTGLSSCLNYCSVQ